MPRLFTGYPAAHAECFDKTVIHRACTLLLFLDILSNFRSVPLNSHSSRARDLALE